MEIEFELVKYSSKYPAKILLQDKPGRRCNTPQHWHKCLELLYMVDGRIMLKTHNGNYTLENDDIAFVNQDVVHGTYAFSDTENINYLVVLLSLDPLRKYIDNIENLWFDIDKNKMARNKIKANLALIARYFLLKEKYYEVAVNSLLYDIYHILLADCLVEKDKLPYESNNNFHYAKNAIEYIGTHYTDDISLSEVSSYVGLSPSYFSRYFKNITKNTFVQYLNGVRLENALRDITQNRTSVTNAALNNGFSGVKSLIRMCKEIYNCTPKQYKKKYMEDLKSRDK